VDSQTQLTFFGKWSVASTRRWSWWKGLSAPQLFVGSFAVLVLTGTLGLKLLPGLYTGEELSWLDAAFTSASAVCVTGLIVVDTATYFTTAGQAFLLLLIQIGGLGIVAFTSLIIVALGRRLSLRQEALATAERDVAPHVGRPGLIRDVVRFTLAIEVTGAVLLLLLWSGNIREQGFFVVAWNAVFHSISAFCNAGFSTFSDSMISYQRSPLTLMVIMALIVVGGIGFLTLEELHLRRLAGKREQIFRVSIHSRLVLSVTAVLLLGGWVLFAFFEWSQTLRDLPMWAKLTNALFCSVTARTAGFNTIDYGQAAAGTNFLTILLMSIGGSPGSTAGGLKTTTFAIIGLLAWSRFRGQLTTSVWGRSIPEETIQRAVGLFVVAFTLVTVCIFILAASEVRMSWRFQFLHYMFEAVSAFNTVGLSMGPTPQLSTTGKVTTIVLMFLGRVGPLTLAAALARPPKAAGRRFRYAYEDVVVG
jgi:trk system potassium uptake protein TrkH